MSLLDNIADTQKIAEILGFTTLRSAANLCRSGKLTTAKKIGDAWVAEIWEVYQYKVEVMAKGKRGRVSKKKEVKAD